jgi:crossover junction endodeoxyribonuclease RuvC
VITIGIDPGLSGAIAVYNTIRKVPMNVIPMPVLKISKGKRDRNVIDLPGLIDIFENLKLYDPQIVVLEQVGPMPKDSPMTAFTFGEGYGLLRACIRFVLGCRTELVPPPTWKRHLKVGKTNGDIMQRADELFPLYGDRWRGPRGGFKDGNAEACMLALYGNMILAGTVPDGAKRPKA